MTDEELLCMRLCELAERAYNNNYYTYTDFLGLAEIDTLKRIHTGNERMRVIPVSLYGGMEGCERQIAAFGSSDLFGYECSYPIACIKISPTAPKFADNLSHRDFLGAVMNLGIERDLIGDIFICNNEGYMFCTEGIVQYIIDNLTKVRHTVIRCILTEERPDIQIHATHMQVQVSSERIDAITAKVYKLSRSNSVKLIQDRKIYISGRLCENSSYALKDQEIVSVRGFGRYQYTGIIKTTGKGNLIVSVVKW